MVHYSTDTVAADLTDSPCYLLTYRQFPNHLLFSLAFRIKFMCCQEEIGGVDNGTFVPQDVASVLSLKTTK